MISIVTPTFNRENLLPRMILSVLQQQFQDWELIIVDDGSTDNTRNLMSSYSDCRIRYIHKENSGAADSRNQGVKEASGEFIIFLDSDDEAKPNWLSSMYEIVSTESASVVCCGLEEYDNSGHLVKLNLPKRLGPLFNNVEGLYLSGTLLLKKDIFLSTGGFDTTLPSGQHTDLFLRLLPKLKENNIQINNIFEPLIQVHIHRGERIRHNHDAIFLGSKRMLDKHKELFSKNKKIQFDYLSMAAVSAFKSKRHKEGKKFLLQALLLNPWNYKSYGRILVGYTPLRFLIW